MVSEGDRIHDFFKESTWQSFVNYANAHEAGDTDAAMRSLLFCHKVLDAMLIRKAGEENDTH
jgi:hypothetical protein